VPYDNLSQYEDAFANASARYGVPENVLKWQVEQESGGDPNAGLINGQAPTDPNTPAGIAQFKGSTAEDYGVDVTDPTSSILGMAHYDSHLEQLNPDAGWQGAVTKYGTIVSPDNPRYANQIADLDSVIADSGDGSVPPGQTPDGSPAQHSDSYWDPLTQQFTSDPVTSNLFNDPGGGGGTGAGTAGTGFGSLLPNLDILPNTNFFGELLYRSGTILLGIVFVIAGVALLVAEHSDRLPTLPIE
jgi:hypothetical protein